MWAVVADNSLLLVAGTAAALLWANLHYPSYAAIAHRLHFAVNDIGMAFFFALATKEIFEATLPGGALASRREAAVPILAAVGGMVAPAGLYVFQALYAGRADLLPGWAVPCATDIAFSYLAARFIFPRSHPAIPFLLLLAIADDAMGLVLLALFYPSGPVSILSFAALMIPAVGVAWILRRRHVSSVWPYVLGAGGLSWAALFAGGIHPALALVPILPFMPHQARDVGLFDPREHDLPDTMNRFEHAWKIPVQFILLLFGFANAGVAFASVGPGSWFVVVALVAGKPLGIVGMTALAVRAGLRSPGGLDYASATVMGIAAGVGFTVSLFFATAAFPAGPLLDEVKMGALMSVAAAPLAIAVGRLALTRR